MPEDVTSKFSRSYWIKVAILVVAGVIAIIWLSVISVEKLDNTSTRIYVIGSAFLLFAACCLYVAFTLKTVSVAKDGITLQYLLTKRQRVIAYTSIKHISSVGVTDIRKPVIKLHYRRLIIELENGKEVNFSDNEFENYDDLKETIRRFRFGLA